MAAMMIIAFTGCAREEEALPRSLVVRGQESTLAHMPYVIIEGDKDHSHDHSIQEASVVAVGDIMVHRSQLIRAYDEEGFDFGPSFANVSPLISEADFAIGNLETTLAGPGGQRRFNVEKFFMNYSGYPTFNTPDIMANNLKDAGFDLMLTANNHTLDSNEAGVFRTLDVLEEAGLETIGSYRSLEDSLEPYIKVVNGIRFGVINYTYAMNGFWLEEDQDYMINNLGNYEEAAIQEMYNKVRTMSKEPVDFVVVAIHYGVEYRDYPDNYYQKPIIDTLFESGADIILGGHPHVLQPFEVRELKRANGEIDQGVVIYSLGNFISSQRHAYTGYDTDFGMVFKMDFEKVDDQKARIKKIGYAPTYVWWGDPDLQILPAYEIPEAINLSYDDVRRLEVLNDEVIPRLNSYYKNDYYMDGPYLMFDLEH